MVPTSLAFPQSVDDLIAKSCSVADVHDKITFTDVSVEQVGAWEFYSL